MKGRAWLMAAALGVALGHSVAHASEPLDLNAAPVTELQGLPGIGPKKAEAIVALRERRPFTRVTQLLEVRGIGKKTLERLRALVVVGPAPPKAGGRPKAANGSTVAAEEAAIPPRASRTLPSASAP